MILYLHTSGWTPPRRRLALSMACVAAAAGALWWAGVGERNAVIHHGQPAANDRSAASGWDGARPDVQRSAKPVAAALTEVSIGPAGASHSQAVVAEAAAPFTYVGQWTDAGVTRVVLGDRGRNLVVRVPGEVDGRYRAISIDENRLVLKDMPLGVLRTLPLVPGTSMKPPPADVPLDTDSAPTPAPAMAPSMVSTMIAPGVHVTPMSVSAVPRPSPGYQDTEQAEN